MTKMYNDNFFKNIKKHMNYCNMRRNLAIRQLGLTPPDDIIKHTAHFNFKCFKCHATCHTIYRLSMPIIIENNIHTNEVLHLCADCTPDNLKDIFDMPISIILKKINKKVVDFLTKILYTKV